jgi:LysM repeat protein
VPLPEFLQLPTPTITPTDTPRPTSTPTSTASPTFTPTPTPLPPIEYQIQDGDSCLGIAFYFDVTVESIIQLNGLDPDCTIAVGHTLLVPQPTPTQTPRPSATVKPGEPTFTPAPGVQATHIVGAGDTCLAIAIYYGVTVEAIMLANNITDCNYLREGQVLKIPAPSASP